MAKLALVAIFWQPEAQPLADYFFELFQYRWVF